MANQSFNIYAIGVGGFGIGSLTRALTLAATRSGLEVAGSETHGLAQRGGVVTGTLRLSPTPLTSPLIIKGTADLVVALEPLEALRALPYLKRGGTIVYNTTRIQPLAVRLKEAPYPALAAIKAELLKATDRVMAVDASAKAKELGLSQALNTVMLGVLARAKVLPFGMEAIREAVLATTPAKFKEVNLKALEVG
jgi:indolepyruvate ferredoxin oxidoreductase beta subunit